MLVLGIETSCDETAAAVVEQTADPIKPWRMRSNVVASQVAIHREWGGVVPELASRQHVRDICGVVERALSDAAATWQDVDALAVTQGPGLVGSLLVGVSFAKSAAWALQRPLVAVNHLAGHIESIWLEHGHIPLPAIILVVSGGHTSLYFIREPGRYELIGRTRDDAAGEAYDKVAKMLGLGYPGGPAIDAVARQGNDTAVRFPKTRLTHADRNAPELPGRRDFSFSGLKTAVLHALPAGADETVKADLARGFEDAVVDTLAIKCERALLASGRRTLIIAGGVGANKRLRAKLHDIAAKRGGRACFPRPDLCTDNGAMIAFTGCLRLALAPGAYSSVRVEARPRWPLEELTDS